MKYGRHAGNGTWVIDRRMFLKSAVAVAAGPALLSLSCVSNQQAGGRRPVRFGIVTDCHYADAETMGTRFYRESLDKLAECAARMNAEQVDFLFELGDFKDQGQPPVEAATLSFVEQIEAVFQQFDGPMYHVLGNHDMDSISKPQFLARVENTGIDPQRSYYSFDVGGVHFIVLDANYKANGADYDRGNFVWTDTNIPSHELDWLGDDLAATRGPAIVFVHQLLDGAGQDYVNNAADVRDVLRSSGKVLAVFQGHRHQGGYSAIEGIHYCTQKALVEGHGPDHNAYAIAEVRPDGEIVLTGYRQAVSRQLVDQRRVLAP
ncbi:MAG: metallophosphoesterase [Sedimentisphaerales bacterium]|nr:metallophosphoesterase [Sedimentisphaerales bacterium]